MKGLKVIVTRKNNAREKRIKELESEYLLTDAYHHHSEFEIERMRADLNRDYPENIEYPCVVICNYASKAVVEDLSDHRLHIVDIEGLKVIHEDETDSNQQQ